MKDNSQIKYRGFVIQKEWYTSARTHWIYWNNDGEDSEVYSDEDLNYIIDHIDELVIDNENQ